MSEKPLPRKPPLGRPRVFQAGEHDPAEAARLGEVIRKGLGNSYVIMNVLDDLADPDHADKRDLVGIISGLMKHLTPEQAVAFAEKLPALLPAEAIARLDSVTREGVAANGAH